MNLIYSTKQPFCFFFFFLNKITNTSRPFEYILTFLFTTVLYLSKKVQYIYLFLNRKLCNILSFDLVLTWLYTAFLSFFYLITWWLLFDTRICRKDYIGEDDLLKKIYTTPSSAECGSTFEEGHDYVISGKDNSIQLNIYRVDFNVLFSFLKEILLVSKIA